MFRPWKYCEVMKEILILQIYKYYREKSSFPVLVSSEEVLILNDPSSTSAAGSKMTAICLLYSYPLHYRMIHVCICPGTEPAY